NTVREACANTKRNFMCVTFCVEILLNSCTNIVPETGVFWVIVVVMTRASSLKVLKGEYEIGKFSGKHARFLQNFLKTTLFREKQTLASLHTFIELIHRPKF